MTTGATAPSQGHALTAASSRGDAAFVALAPPLATSLPNDTPAPPSAPPSDEDPMSEPLSPESSSPDAVPNSQAIGRIKLRKTSNTGIAEHSTATGAPDSPRNLHEAFDSLTADLDRIADRIRPTWEAPSSRRVTELGDDPEVVVHYPPEWQPPPSERRRLLAHSEQATPKLPLSRTPQTAELIDEGWEPPDDARPADGTQPTPVLLAATPAADGTEPEALTRQARDAKPSPNPNVHAALAPRSTQPLHKLKGPGLDSTAPSAVSQTPPAAVARSRAGLWGAGFAAAALVALVWRSASTPPAPAVSTNAERASSVLQAPERAPGPEPRSVGAAAPAPTPMASPLPVAQAAPPATSTDAAASVPSNDALAAATITPAPAPVSAATTTSPSPPADPLPTSAPKAPAPAAPAPAAPTPAAPRDEPLAPAQAAEAPGPDPGAVAQALSESAARARACSDPNGPNGAGSIRVLLNPLGGVLNATALGPFQSTATGRCVESAFRSARTPAYDGRSLSTVYPFSLAGE